MNPNTLSTIRRAIASAEDQTVGNVSYWTVEMKTAAEHGNDTYQAMSHRMRAHQDGVALGLRLAKNILTDALRAEETDCTCQQAAIDCTC